MSKNNSQKAGVCVVSRPRPSGIKKCRAERRNSEKRESDLRWSFNRLLLALRAFMCQSNVYMPRYVHKSRSDRLLSTARRRFGRNRRQGLGLVPKTSGRVTVGTRAIAQLSSRGPVESAERLVNPSRRQTIRQVSDVPSDKVPELELVDRN
jgi:hypothetical protein